MCRDVNVIIYSFFRFILSPTPKHWTNWVNVTYPTAHTASAVWALWLCMCCCMWNSMASYGTCVLCVLTWIRCLCAPFRKLQHHVDVLILEDKFHSKFFLLQHTFACTRSSYCVAPRSDEIFPFHFHFSMIYACYGRHFTSASADLPRNIPAHNTHAHMGTHQRCCFHLPFANCLFLLSIFGIIYRRIFMDISSPSTPNHTRNFLFRKAQVKAASAVRTTPAKSTKFSLTHI